MTNEQMKTMDSYILLSWVNAKLRDEFGSLELLCEEFGFEKSVLRQKLKNIEYIYSESGNQFKSMDV